MDQLHAIIGEELARRLALGQPCEVAHVSAPRGREFPGGACILTLEITLRPVTIRTNQVPTDCT